MLDSSVLVAILALGGALAAGVMALSRPRVALGVLFLLASFSRATLETPIGTMRPEMPAIAVVAVILLAGGRFTVLARLPRSNLIIALAFGTYLGVLTVSSAFVAPGTAQSLRMVAWLAVSMAGGVVAFVLAQHQPTATKGSFALVGAINGTAGIAVAVMFLAAGPSFTLGIQESEAILPRVYAFGWEANLYASFLAMVAFFAFELVRRRRGRAAIGMLALVLVGFPLGVTRGAYGGLAAGALVYVAVLLAVGHRTEVVRRTADLVRVGTLVAVMLAVGFGASNVLLPNADERSDGTIAAAPGQTPAPSAEPGQTPSGEPGQTPSGEPGQTPSGEPGQTPSGSAEPGQTPSPSATLEPYPDTLGFRLERVPIAFEDLRNSPLIGFGAESFGQRHPDRYAGAGPDHIAILAVVVPYEAGIIGAAGLALGFALLFIALWRSARRSARLGDGSAAGDAAAFIGSLVSVLVAYQLNNALHLAVNWIVIGAAMVLVARDAQPDAT